MTTIYRSTYSIDIKGKFLDMNMSEASARLDSLSAETRGVFATLDELLNFHVREYNRSIDNFKSLDIPYASNLVSMRFAIVRKGQRTLF